MNTIDGACEQIGCFKENGNKGKLILRVRKRHLKILGGIIKKKVIGEFETQRIYRRQKGQKDIAIKLLTSFTNRYCKR